MIIAACWICPMHTRFWINVLKFYRAHLTAHFQEIPSLCSYILNLQLSQNLDHSQCSNYRPISLLNIDLKLFSKIITNRLAPLLPSLVHSDQVGFIPGREARDNTTKTLHLISYAQHQNIPTCLLACDAEKAFDRVRWPFLQTSLQQIGLGPKLLTKIMSLYTKPSVKVTANWEVLEAFEIRNGTRQGCPLSPLLFAITIEHLAQATTPFTGSPHPRLIANFPYMQMTCYSMLHNHTLVSPP